MIRFFSDVDHNQSLRIKRFFMGVSAYALGCGLSITLYALALTRISFNALVTSIFCVLASNLVLYIIFRSGLNKRFSDPSLTLAQMILATFWIMLVTYYADQARCLVLLLYLVVFIFGLFRLRVHQFLFLSLFAVVNYALVIIFLYRSHPEYVNDPIDIFSVFVLATVLPWFSMVGGYITRLRSQVSKALINIEHLAIIDDLTQVFNRRQMYQILEQQKALGDRGIHPFSICIFALDHFKHVNETYGHTAGDTVLKTVAQEVHRNLRDIDHIARYGGEEFIIILTNSGSREAMVCAKRIRQMAREIQFPSMPPSFRITISVGVTRYRSSEPIQEAVDRADKALQTAKSKGRDRVEYEPVTPKEEL